MFSNQVKKIPLIIFTSFLFLCFLIGKAEAKEDIRIGVSRSTAYYSLTETGAPYGFGYEYLEHLAEVGDFNFIFIYGSKPELLRLLKDDKLDLIGQTIKSPELEQDFLFSSLPTGYTYQSLVALKSNPTLIENNFQIYSGMKIGLLEHEKYNKKINELASSTHSSFFTYSYPTIQTLEEALNRSELDAIVKNNSFITPLERVMTELATIDYYFITSKSKPELIEKISLAQAELYASYENFVSNLHAKYFSSSNSSFKFQDKEVEYVNSLDELVVLYLNNSTPFSYYDVANDRADGVYIKIWDNISQQTGLKYTLQSVDTIEEAMKLLNAGSADVFLGVNQNNPLISKYDIRVSDEVLESPLVIIGKQKKIVAQDVFVLERNRPERLEYIKTNYPKNTIILVDTLREAYDAIKNNDAQFTIDDIFSASYLLEVPEYLGFILVTATLTNSHMSLALSTQSDPILFSIINKAILNFSMQDNDSLFLSHTLKKHEEYGNLSFFIERYQVEFFTALILVSFTFCVILIIFSLLQTQSRRRAWDLAYIDQLTRLPNFNKFKIDAQKIIYENTTLQYSILKFDINKFNLINETKGFDEGDRIIRAVKDIILTIINPKTDILARISADNYILLTVSQESKIDDVLSKYYYPLKDKLYNVAGYKLNFAIGRYVLNQDDVDISEIYEKVNYAHALAKINSAISPLYDYDDELKKQAIRQREIEDKMDSALENNEFAVYLQPKYSLRDESLVGAEALVRWNENSTSDMVYPSEFIPLFEKNGFITRLDFYMFRKSCEIISEWIKEGFEPVTISINFSRLHLNNPNLVEEINNIANFYNIPKKFLEIELTESTMLDNEELLEKLLNDLHNSGYTLSMDDFGTGYSSLGLLKNLPVDVIKIDRSFFTNNRYKSRAKAVLESIISMAKALNIHTVAEGVEEVEHVDFLRSIGCEYVQGYYYAKPMHSSEFKLNQKAKVQNIPTENKHDYNIVLTKVLERRKELGDSIPLTIHSLFDYSIKEALIQTYGEGEMSDVYVLAGRIAGVNFARKYKDLSLSTDEFFSQIKKEMKDEKVGILDIVEHNPSTGKYVFILTEHLDCANISDLNNIKCAFSEGFLAGLLSEFYNRYYSVNERMCRARGDKDCIFEASCL